MNKIDLINDDCMNVIPEYETNYFDLAIVDPPYGLPEFSENPEQGTGVLRNRIFQEMDKNKWDKAPDDLYFKELFRVSKNQIIWGGNYFNLPPTREIICWDKEQPFPNFSAWEFAWTSFNKPAKIFRMNNRVKNKIHPTEKPVKLYKWLLKQYAKSGQLILDTHLGSGNIAIACHDYNCNLLGIEINLAYYKKASKNYKDYKNQGNLFETRM
tara:strand:- start:657 stop:1292 length:636 start_codon:yes stop_codon:yes gene_type:complete